MPQKYRSVDGSKNNHERNTDLEKFPKEFDKCLRKDYDPIYYFSKEMLANIRTSINSLYIKNPIRFKHLHLVVKKLEKFTQSKGDVEFNGSDVGAFRNASREIHWLNEVAFGIEKIRKSRCKSYNEYQKIATYDEYFKKELVKYDEGDCKNENEFDIEDDQCDEDEDDLWIDGFPGVPLCYQIFDEKYDLENEYDQDARARRCNDYDVL